MPPGELNDLVRAMDAATSATVKATEVQVQIMAKLDSLITMNNLERKWFFGIIVFLILAVLTISGTKIATLAGYASSLGLGVP